LVGNIPTEEVLGALKKRGVTLPVDGELAEVIPMNAAISEEFTGGF